MVQPTNKRFLLESDKGAANGVATLGGDTKVPDTQLPARLQPGTVATLDGAGKLDTPQLPAWLTGAALDTAYMVDDRGYASLQAAVDATPDGGVLEIRRQWIVASPPTLSKAIRLTCTRGGSVTTTGSGTHAFNVTGNNVVFDTVTMLGTGTATAETAIAIKVTASEAAPITGLVVRNCTIKNFSKTGIEGTSVKDFTIVGNYIENIAYAGIMLLAAARGYVLSNTVKTITQPALTGAGTTGFVNSYGIAMTRNSSQSLAVSPRSSDIVCANNIIDGVTKWEAIDSHGGENLTISNNKVSNAFIGIAMVPCPNEAGNDTYAPKNVIITGNTVESGKTDGTNRAGIQLIGCLGATVDTVVEYASGVVSDNLVRNFGIENTTTQAAVFIQATRGAIVSSNRIVNASPNAILLSNNNQGCMVLDNTAVDTWTNASAFTSAVYVQSVHQTISLRGNRVVRADKTATLVNDRGLYLSSTLTSPDVEIQYGENHFKLCTTPIVDSPTTQNITEQRIEARKISFYPGGVPIARQTIAAAATDLATVITLANDTRAKLKGLNIVV